MVYQHSKSINRIVTNAKKENGSGCLRLRYRRWAKKHVSLCKMSLSNKYFLSLSITHYQAFFLFVWIYFLLVYLVWLVSMIFYPFICLFSKSLRKDSSNSWRN